MSGFKKIIEDYRDRLLKLDHVVGVGQGIKQKNGKKTGEEAVIVLVDEKLSPSKIGKKNLVPQSLDGHKTDIIEIGKINLFEQLRTVKMRPAQPGVSIGHYQISAGTMGAVVKDKKTGSPLILSNNHVLANITNGNDGRSKIGDPILQPGSYDDGAKPDDIIGKLERFIPLNKGVGTSQCSIAIATEKVANYLIHLFKPHYSVKFFKQEGYNLVDCALARPVNKRDISPDILEIGPVKGVKEPKVGFKVQKSGRTSGLTTGEILAVGVTIEVNLSETEVSTFEDQFVTEAISKPGDSGSLVLDMENNAVGLLFAGSDKATVCNRITNVLDLLQIEF